MDGEVRYCCKAVGVFLGAVVGYDLLIGKVIQVVMIASRFCFLNLVTSWTSSFFIRRRLTDNQMSGILADDMGLGKTVQTLALLAFLAEIRQQPGADFCNLSILSLQSDSPVRLCQESPLRFFMIFRCSHFGFLGGCFFSYLQKMAGAMASMAHVPKRAVQHGIYTPLHEVSPPCLKPGQKELNPCGLYSTEAKQKDTFALRQVPKLLEDGQNESEYTKRVCKAICPEDFKTPRGDKRADKDESRQAGAAHWRSEYAHNSVEGCKPKSHLTAEQILNNRMVPTPRCCISKLQSFTCSQADYGRNGSNPRDKITPRDTQLPVVTNDLTAGSTRGTNHIPGYQGVIPNCANLRRATKGTPRTVDKTNIVHVFHKNLVGYAGHVPEAVCNDLGGRRPTDLTTFGHDFKAHKIGALCWPRRSAGCGRMTGDIKWHLHEGVKRWLYSCNSNLFQIKFSRCRSSWTSNLVVFSIQFVKVGNISMTCSPLEAHTLW